MRLCVCFFRFRFHRLQLRKPFTTCNPKKAGRVMPCYLRAGEFVPTAAQRDPPEMVVGPQSKFSVDGQHRHQIQSMAPEQRNGATYSGTITSSALSLRSGLPDHNHTLTASCTVSPTTSISGSRRRILPQALEFDINQFTGGKSFIWGHECRVAGGHQWDIYDNINHKWVPTGVACNPVSGAWNHLIIQVRAHHRRPVVVQVHHAERKNRRP